MILELSNSLAYDICILEVKNNKYYSIRKMYRTKGDSTWKPTSKHISLPKDKKVLKQLFVGLVNCEEVKKL